jgi:HD-like signal output (HDOD) protein
MYQWLKRLIQGPGQQPGAARPPATQTQPAALPETAPDGVPDREPPNAPHAPPPACASAPAYEQKEQVDAAFSAWLFGDWQPDNDGGAAAAEARVLEAMNGIARSPHAGADLMRRMPGVVPQLLQSLRSETFSGADIARKISSDVVMVAEVIRLANSSALASGHPVTSVQNAVLVIGQEGLRQLVTSVAFRPIIDFNAGVHTRRIAPRIWDHAERCAHACRKLAPQFGVEPLDAFLAGLVLNAGMMVSLAGMDRSTPQGQRLGSPAFTARLQTAARLISSGIAKEWRFPDTVIRALGEQVAARKEMSAMGRLLAQVDYACKIKILAENGKADGKDAWLEGLPEAVLACYPEMVKTSSAYK